MIQLRTLGECVIQIGHESFTPDADALFAATLYLAAERGKRVARDHLAELIWPTLPLPRARHCLRQIVYRLRVLGVPVDGARESLLLPDALVLPTFSASPSPVRLSEERAAGTLHLGPFLPGYRPPHSEAFAEWLETTRSTMEARVRRALLELAQVRKLRGEWGEVDALARECLRLDPLNEEATFAIAECAAMVGGKSDALAILDRFSDDLGAKPADLRIPVMVLRRRIAERFPTRRYNAPSDRCFVGRADLFESLTTALLRARNGESSAVLLTGVPGIGKTRLVQELTSVAVMQGVRTVRVGCDETDAQRPMSAWVDAVPMLRELPGALGVSPESLRFLRRLTEIDPNDASLTDSFRDPRWIAHRIRQALLDLLDAVSAEHPLLLVLEDVHWLDAASWATVTAILDWMTGHRLLLVLTSRGPHPTGATPARCLEQLIVHAVPALDDAAALALGRAIAADHGGPIDERALQWCVEVGEGNPLFLRELAVHCLEGGALQVVPPTLHPLINARLERLSPTAQRVAETMAVMGAACTLDRVERVLQMPAYELAGALHELSQASLLGDLPNAVGLRHRVISALVLERTPVQIQRLLHRRAAITLEQDAADSPTGDTLWALLTHAKEASEEHRIRPFVLHGARHLMQIGAPRSAASLVERTLPLLVGGSQYHDALRLYCRVLGLDGQWRAAYKAAQQLLEDRSTASQHETAALDTLALFEAGIRSAEDPAPLQGKILQIARDTGLSPLVRLQASRCGLTLSAITGSAPNNESFHLAIVDLRKEPGNSQIQVDELEMIYHANSGNIREATELADRLSERAPALSDPFAILSLYVAIVDTYRVADDRDQAVRVSLEGVHLARSLGSEHFELTLLGRVLTVQLELGDVAAVRAGFARFSTLAARSEHHTLASSADVIGARMALADGQSSYARELAIRAYNASRSAPQQLIAQRRIATTLAVEVWLKTEAGKVDEELLRELHEVHSAMQSFVLHDRTMAVLDAALRRSGHDALADKLLRDYMGVHRRAGRSWEHNVLCLRLQPNDLLPHSGL